MPASRHALRTLGVLAAATGLTVAGAGAAHATTSEHQVDGNRVSVTFELDPGLIQGDVCGAVVATPENAVGLAAEFASGDLEGVFETLANDDDVHVLYRDGLIADTPFVALGAAGGIGITRGTVAAEVPSNVYTLVSVCLSDRTNPTVVPTLLVGDPLDAALGSVQGSLGGSLGS